MTLRRKADAERFRSRGGDLFGGDYSGLGPFTSRAVGRLDKTKVVPEGEWSLVVIRPKSASPE